MGLSTTTGMFGNRIGGGCPPYAEALKRCVAAGFDVLDVNFCQAINGKTDLFRTTGRYNEHIRET